MNPETVGYFLGKFEDDVAAINEIFIEAVKASEPENKISLFKEVLLKSQTLKMCFLDLEQLIRKIPNANQHIFTPLSSYQELILIFENKSLKYILELEELIERINKIQSESVVK
ncbi:hypothetical protein [Clostridium perfringens]|uniref:hypothetical protein n=1 Tax=Clostridium perfringens TaxID=1502 RepID=UPI0018E4A51D|nr:hypothetical protein [Clostridium perfringens]MBI6108741.1 hypothetical protein [Clostridium perfringens]UUR88584.1 hypothetical protein NQ194_16660 [Clostridium perfringens]